jgi:hypothetical protein
MASETLVKQDLTPEMISAGADLVRALDAANIPVTAAFWLYYGEEPDWRLRIVSPEVAQLGTLQFYRKLGDHMRALRRPELTSSNVTATEPEDRIVVALRKALRAPGINSIRYTGNVFNGILFPDALIYRVT